MEIWKDIKGYNGEYQVSNLGNVRRILPKKARILKGGYMQVQIKGKDYKVHRLVAEAFIDNTDNLPMVNHKDEDKTNNRVDNLEWCNSKYNTNYGTAISRRVKSFRTRFENDLTYKTSVQKRAIVNGKKAGKPVYVYDSEMAFVYKFDSRRECCRTLNIDEKYLSTRIDSGELCKDYLVFSSLQTKC